MGAAVSRYFRWLSTGGSSTGADPAVPTLTVVDNADGTGGVATIAGSSGGSVNTLYAALWTGTGGGLTWSSAGSRVGDGTIATALQGAYVWYVSSTLAGFTSVTGVYYRPLTSLVATDALEDLIASAIVAELNDAARPWNALFSAEGATALRTRAPWYKAADLATLKVAVVPLTLERDRIARATGRRQLSFGMGIDFQRMVAPTDDTELKKLSRLAEQVHDFFDDAHALATLPQWCCLQTDRPDIYSLPILYGERTWETFLAVTVVGFKV